ncbi:MAG: WbqC family protein [Desulfobacterales bacterium]|jgi:hypothetical protein
MIVAVNQPYFAPYPGFFYKACLCDYFVILDDVQFPRGTTWITRNRFKNDQGTLWMTIPVWKKGLGLQRIGSVRICREGRWARKHMESLRHAYANAPFIDKHLEFLKGIFEADHEKIIDLNLEIIRYIVECLEINTRIVLQSELDASGTGDRLLIKICRQLGGTHFLAQGATKKFVDENLMRQAGFLVRYFTPPRLTYPQLWGDYIANLSTFDLMFNCGPKAGDIVRGKALRLTIDD